METDGQHSQITTLEYLGDRQLARLRYDAAAKSYERALAGARELGDRVVEARVLRGIASATIRGGHRDHGRRWLSVAADAADRIGGPLAHDIQRQLAVLVIAAGRRGA